MDWRFSKSRVGIADDHFPWFLVSGAIASGWVVICLPAILFSQWFPLDLPRIFELGADLEKWLPWIVSPYNGSGRYFPVYWLYYCLPFSIFGMDVRPYLLIQSLVFVIALVFGARIIYQTTRSTTFTILAIVFSLFSTALPENISTVGKGEILAYTFCISAFALFLSRPDSLYRSGIAAFLFCFAIWTKETSLALLAVPVGGIIITTAVAACRSWTQPKRSQYVRFLVALLLGFGLSRIPYLVFPDESGSSTYTTYPINSELVIGNIEFYIFQQPDLFVFGIASTIALSAQLWASFTGRLRPNRYLPLFLSVCGAAWGYIVVLLVWRWPMAYYTLMPAMFFRLAFVYSVCTFCQHSWSRVVSIAMAAITCLFVLPYSIYIIESQIAYSRLYTEALQTYVEEPERGNLIMENYPFFSEQVGGTSQYLQLLGLRATVKGIGDLMDPTPFPKALLNLLDLTQEDIGKNTSNLPREGDYVLTFTGDKLATWFLRGVTPYYRENSMLGIQSPYQARLVSESEIRFPAVFINTWTWLPEARFTFLGYKLFRIGEDEPKFLWLGHYLDGWIGRSASLQINKSFSGPVHLKASAPNFALPNKLTIKMNGEVIKSILFNSTDEMDIILPVDAGRQTLFEFEVEKAISPSLIGMNKDIRLLGVRLNFSNEISGAASDLNESIGIPKSAGN